MRKTILLGCLAACVFFGTKLKAQEFRMPAASPTVHVNQDFSTSFIKMDYSRPSLRGRDLFGHQIPYGEVWRTGANSATKITFGEDVFLSDQPVKAGTYALYTIPEKETWTVILNEGVSNWGADGFDSNDNVLRVTLPVEELAEKQETFRISLEDITLHTGNIVMAWDHIQVKIPVQADNNQRILDHLAEQLKGDKPPYGQAAGYYLATDQKLEEGLEYIQKAVEANPKAWYLYWTEAQLYQKQGQHTQAVEAAKKAADLSKGGAFEAEYEQHYQDMLKQK